MILEIENETKEEIFEELPKGKLNNFSFRSKFFGPKNVKVNFYGLEGAHKHKLIMNIEKVNTVSKFTIQNFIDSQNLDFEVSEVYIYFKTDIYSKKFSKHNEFFSMYKKENGLWTVENKDKKIAFRN